MKRHDDRGFNDSVGLAQGKDQSRTWETDEVAVMQIRTTLEIMGTKPRDRVLNVRLIESEAAMLAALAEREGMSVSEWIRTTIRVQHALAFRGRKRARGGISK